jgi:triosephosphate isomerase (TIM)
MENKFLIVANTKQNPLPKYDFYPPENLEVVVAPQFDEISSVPEGFVRGAQNVENNASELKNLGVKYCLVGHSYYRNNFGETNEIVQQKVSQLLEYGIIPILCARNLSEVIPAPIIMFEPEEAISTNGQYHPASLEKIKKVLATFPKDSRLLYGGSVNPENTRQLVSSKLVRGFVVGHACLDPQTFLDIINQCF